MGVVAGNVTTGVTVVLVALWVVCLVLPCWHVHYHTPLHKRSTEWEAGLFGISTKHQGVEKWRSFREFRDFNCNDPIWSLIWGPQQCEAVNNAEVGSLVMFVGGIVVAILLVVAAILNHCYWNGNASSGLRKWATGLYATGALLAAAALGLYGFLTKDIFDFTSHIATLNMLSGHGNGETVSFSSAMYSECLVALFIIALPVLCFAAGQDAFEDAVDDEDELLKKAYSAAPQLGAPQPGGPQGIPQTYGAQAYGEQMYGAQTSGAQMYGAQTSGAQMYGGMQ